MGHRVGFPKGVSRSKAPIGDLRLAIFAKSKQTANGNLRRETPIGK